MFDTGTVEMTKTQPCPPGARLQGKKDLYMNNYKMEREMTKRVQLEKAKRAGEVHCAGRWVGTGAGLIEGYI